MKNINQAFADWAATRSMFWVKKLGGNVLFGHIIRQLERDFFSAYNAGLEAAEEMIEMEYEDGTDEPIVKWSRGVIEQIGNLKR